jgi:hypothetical protein
MVVHTVSSGKEKSSRSKVNAIKNCVEDLRWPVLNDAIHKHHSLRTLGLVAPAGEWLIAPINKTFSDPDTSLESESDSNTKQSKLTLKLREPATKIEYAAFSPRARDAILPPRPRPVAV